MIRDAANATLRGLVLAGLSVVGLVALLAHAIVLVLSVSVGLIVLIPWAVEFGRWVADQRRRFAAKWDGVLIVQPYQPAPPPPQPDDEGMYVSDNTLYKTPRMPALANQIDWVVDDRSTWRDLWWLLVNATLGNIFALTPAFLVVYGALNLPWGGLLAIWGLLSAPILMRVHTNLTVRLLGPSKRRTSAQLSRRLTSWTRSMGLFGMGMLSLVLLVEHLLALVTVVLFPIAAEKGREATNLRRDLSGKWSGTPIARPYLPRPQGIPRWKWVIHDRATWRDLLFLAVDPIVTLGLTVLPSMLVIYAGWGLLVPQSWRWFLSDKDQEWGGGFYGQFAGSDLLAVPMAAVITALAVWMAPYSIKLTGRWTQILLAPTEQAQLALRVQELTQTRAETTDAQAAELRRIERDLHDGAQARLVAMGLGLGALERLIDQDPAAAKTLLAKVRDNSAKALVELRGLVRGIHPPVLADRGLGDAVRALALDTPMPVQVCVNLPRRLDPPVESAAYFAISEALTNVTKHARANTVTVDVVLDGVVLRLTVRDDGCGGADVSRGTGLLGIQRRLSAFDGSMTVHSPVGGPTTVTMTLRVSGD
ncbi:signal transduction histidine kinase [Kibdelosporangium banguiense]|uniref:histidine kinase n=1 Tax=Kibdelosporangium banguiense TaxID=1365924 RepID=A0ABS4TJB2_9PSEU|nr:sensor domain-containing protein [Kibdelosporangium banguiense]MBP2324507.1 signal transduction histidine kinase [Kibdelosporangium banguiense]